MKTLKGLDIMVFIISWGRLCRGVCFLHSFRLSTLVFYFWLAISENLSKIFLLKSLIQYFNSCEYCNMEVSCGVFFLYLLLNPWPTAFFKYSIASYFHYLQLKYFYFSVLVISIYYLIFLLVHLPLCFLASQMFSLILINVHMISYKLIISYFLYVIPLYHSR